MALDHYDLSILEALQKDGRMSLTDLGKILGISRFAVKDRIENLFRDEIILGPTIVVNPSLVGYERTLFFELKTNPHEPWLAELLEKTGSCDMLDGITGEYSLLGRFRFSNDEHFGQTLKRIDEAMSRSFFKKYRVVNVIRTFKEFDVPFERKTRALNLDNIDLKILEILLNQTEYVKTPQPISTTQISRLLRNMGIKISQPTVFKRLTRLEDDGVILRHTLRVNKAKMGAKTKLIVGVKVNPAFYDTIARDFLAKMNEVTDLYRTGEDYGLLAIIRISNISQYNSFLLRLYETKDILDTCTTLVLEERKISTLPLGRLIK